MAKVSIRMGDEVELVGNDFRITFGKLKSVSPLEMQREPGNSIVCPDGKRIEIPGAIETYSVRLDFDVMRHHLKVENLNGEGIADGGRPVGE